MADGKDADPLAPWRDLVAQWEKNVNAVANRTMATDEYAGSMHSAMGLTMKLQETLRDAMATYLANANLPSRSEVLGIAERIGAIESRLDRMQSLLERIAATPAEEPLRAPRPPRTKRPPDAAGSKPPA